MTARGDRPHGSLLGKRVLVTGAAGSIAEAVAQVCIDDGAELLAFDLHEPPARSAHLFSDVVTGDIRDARLLAKSVDRADVVVHLAGWVHKVVRGAEDLRLVHEINHRATADLARRCAQRGCHLVLASTVAVHGESFAGELSDTTPRAPDTPYAVSKARAEDEVRERGGVVLRLPMVYGALDKGNMLAMIRAIDRGLFVVPWPDRARRTFVGRWNVAEAVRCVLLPGPADGGAFLAADDESHSIGEQADLIAGLLGRRKPLRVPRFLLLAGAEAGTLVERLTGRPLPLNRERLRKLGRELTAKASGLRAVAGYHPLKSFAEGLAEEVEWYRSET